MLTAAVVRDARIRAAFEVIGWINLSQAPNLKALQARLYHQLSSGKEMTKSGTNSVENGVDELQKVVAKRLVLIVLDGRSLTIAHPKCNRVMILRAL